MAPCLLGYHLNLLSQIPPAVHSEVASALARVGEPAVSGLLEMLQDKEWTVRWQAAHTLGRIGDTRAVPALVDALQDKEWTVRYYTAYSLGWIGDLYTVPALQDACKDESEKVREAAEWALERIRERFPETSPDQE